MFNNDDDLEKFFEDKKELKAYCSEFVGKQCIKYKMRDNGSYIKIFCSEPDCQFQLTYNFRNTDKIPKGYYMVIKGTCLNHKVNCSNCISNLSNTKNAKFISKQIVPLFQEKSPSINEIRSAIRCFNNEDFSLSELKYIKKLAKKLYFKGATTTISKLVQFCQNLVSTHNWKFDIQFVEGMIASIVLFPPWANNLIKYFYNPLIVDATFTCENLRFISAVVFDGERQTQAVGLVIRGTEDTKGYSILFQFVSQIIGNNIITIMADMARCIQKAANDCFKSHNFVFCFYHFKQNFLKNNKFTPSEGLWLIFEQFMRGEVSEDTLRNKWFEEESFVDSELKGYEYISKKAFYFAPNSSTHKRGIITSQRIEMFNNVLKKNGNSAFEMLRQFFHIATSWFEKGSTIIYKDNHLLTHFAEDLLNEKIKEEFLTEEFDQSLHYKKK